MLNFKGWVGPKGERCLDPKTAGDGFMVSAFKSRDLGFGHAPFTVEEIFKINQHRQGKEYIDKEAAIEVLGSVGKADSPLTTSDNPFIHYLLIGKYNEGYWSSAHMAIQFENVIDCCVALYGRTFDFLFLFDHSCGHDRKPVGALDAKALNVGYGGCQPVMSASTIQRSEGYLGRHCHPGVLKPGDTAKFQYEEGDDGPFYFTAVEREEKKSDITITSRFAYRNKTKKELTSELVSKGVRNMDQGRVSLNALQELAQKNAVELKVKIPVVHEGWMGKPKGLLQICWERGFIDPSRKYTKMELIEIIGACTDFENAETNLQMIARRLGVQAERSPKFHCELAGEGIEYDWSFCKGKYRCRPLTEKKGRANFKKLVQEVTSWSFVTKEQSKRSSARARSYISGYFNIHYDNSSLLKQNTTHEQELTESSSIQETSSTSSPASLPTTRPWKPAPGEVISMDIIEKAKKQYHSHRGVNSFEKGAVPERTQSAAT
jgi:hypothetical protein